jgi:hypothetical protein
MDEQPQETIQPVVEKRFPTIAIVLICVLLSGTVFGAAGYFGGNYIATGKTTALSYQITKLTAEKADLQKQLDDAIKSLADTAQAEAQSEASLLRVVYTPESSFTDDEKKMLDQKVITAYIDFYGPEFGLNDPVQTIVVKKDFVKDLPAIFTFEFIQKTAFAKYSLIAGADKTYPYWYPMCKFTDCRDVPQGFAEKYPELIAKSKADMPMGAGLRTNSADTITPAPAPTPTPKQ